jgi:hypothetical protein
MSKTALRNIEKFDFIESRFKEKVALTVEEYKFFLSGELEVALCFLDEYHFKDIRQEGEKLAVCKAFLAATFAATPDSGQLETLLSFAKKIKYWKVFEDCILPISLKDLNANVAITYLDFLIDHHTHFDMLSLENFLLKNDNQTILILQFLVKSALYIIDYQKYADLFFDFITANRKESLIFKRLVRMENKLAYKGKNHLSNFMVKMYVSELV